jgi:hypothetical protein
MHNLDTAMADVRASVAELMAASERSAGPNWTKPSGPGKWSPAQIVEHVARAFETSADVAAGKPSMFPTMPRIVRPLARVAFFNRTLKSGKFPKAKTNPAMNPERGSATVDEARVRLNDAVAKFDAASRALVAQGRSMSHPIFGNVGVAEYAHFQAIHTRHHVKQMPTA